MNSRFLGVPRPHAAHRATRYVLGALTASALALGVSGTTQEPASALPVDTVAVRTAVLASSTYEERVQHFVNRRRAAHGLRRLRFAACPDVTAERWSRHLALNDSFYHQSMSSVLDRCNARYAGETLGRGTMSPRRLVRLWMQSPGHRAILLSKSPRRIGVGATPDANGRWVVAANFIRF